MADNGEQLYNSLMNGLQKIFKELEKKLSQNNIYSKEQELLKKFINGHGAIMGSQVLADQFEDIKAELIKQKIPFTAIPSQDGNYCILVREQYQHDLITIEESIMSCDTRYAKELEMNNALKILKQQGVKHATVYTVDNEIAEVTKQKLFQSGVTYSSYPDKKDPTKTNIVIFPSSLYRSSGQDTEYFKLNYALMQMKASSLFMTPKNRQFNEDLKQKLDKKEITLDEYNSLKKKNDFIDIRTQQAAYDERKIKEFIRAARNGQSVSLGNIKGGGPYFEAQDGKITFHKQNQSTIEIKYTSDDSLDTLYATLSRHTEDILNMQVFDSADYDMYLKNTKEKAHLLPDKYKHDVRPELNTRNTEYNDAISKCFESFIKQANIDATNIVKNLDTSQSAFQLAQIKHNELIKILNDPNSNARQQLQQSLIQNTTIQKITNTYNITTSELIDNFATNFADEHQNVAYELEVNRVSVREIQKVVVDKEGHIEEAYEPDFE